MIQFTDEQMRKLIKEETEKFLNSPYDESFDLVLEGVVSEKAGDAKHLAYLKSKYPNLPDARLQKLALMQGEKGRARRQAASGGGGAGGTPAASAVGTTPPSPSGVVPQQPMDEPNPAAQQQALATTQPNTPAAAKQTWGDKLKQAGGKAAKWAATKGKDLAKDATYAAGRGLRDLGVGAVKGVGDAVGAGVGGAIGGTVKGIAKGVKGAMDMFRGNPVQKMAKKAQKAGLGAAEIAKLHQAYQSGALSEKQIATLKLMERCLKSDKVRIIKENKKPIIIDV